MSGTGSRPRVYPRVVRALRFAAVFGLTGCISAISKPDAPDSVPPSKAVALFHVSRGAYIFGGRDGVIEALAEAFPDSQETDQYDPPPNGTFVRVRTHDFEMSMGGKIYGYIAWIVFIGTIPFYNGETGVEVIFEVFRNGQLAGTFKYPVHRHLFVWLPVLPFSWISAITPSEYDGTHAAAFAFAADARAVLEGSK